MSAKTAAELNRGRESYGRRAWNEAYRSLTRADEAAPLAVDDLDLLAWSAALVGRDEDFLRVLERVYHARLEASEHVRAARAAFWLTIRFFLLGEPGRAAGWLARAHRIIESEKKDCVEQGYLLIPAALRHLAAGEYDAACTAAAAAAETGDRFGEADLIAIARDLQGQALTRQGQIENGIALLDEAMLAAAEGVLSPIVTGIVYCSVIASYQKIYAFDRAREWTSALAEWCEAQPELVTFTGVCRVHRAEVMQINGAWDEAIEETRRAFECLVETNDREATAAALYQEAEICRLRGDYAAAEKAYQGANQWGMEPHPGLALLRLAQGQKKAAAGAIRRAIKVSTDPLQRAKLLPAAVEIMLAVGAGEEADDASRELEEIAARFNTEVLGAMAAHARGAVELAAGEAQAALGPLRHAFTVWGRVGAPYLAARVRVPLGLACRALGDDDGANLELGAARVVFEQLGAGPDLAWVDALTGRAAPDRPHGLTPRELQVLRMVAAGDTNKAIAHELRLSERTIDRHVSNIFNKLDVSTRAAATAHAYQQKLV